MERTVLDVAVGALSDYYDWMQAAAHGDVLIYWTGDLQYDRQVEVPENDVMRAADRQRVIMLNMVADRASKDAKQGLLHLTQRRISGGVFEYRATRRRQLLGKSTLVQPNDQLVLA
jgi:hypothetical protein